MADNSFFDESTEQSRIKATIVQQYFWVWASVMIPSAARRDNKIAYIDLFAGPGRYKDGRKSTPMLVLEQAIRDPKMRQMLVAIFNDVDTDSSQLLRKAIQELPDIESLRYEPIVYNEDVNGGELVKKFEKMKLIPALVFIDPWGYKGLSRRLINSVLKDWGCECIVFFNYNRINMGLRNTAVEEHMQVLFGEKRVPELRRELKKLTPAEREDAILQALAEALREMGDDYVLPFCFKTEAGTRTSHYLILVTKHPKGYGIMKEIMAKQSSTAPQGVPSFEYNPASAKNPSLFERPLDELGVMLLKEFAGQTVTMGNIYEQHNVGRRYIKSNYKAVLTKLEAEGRIRAKPPAKHRRKFKGIVTFGDDVLAVFRPVR